MGAAIETSRFCLLGPLLFPIFVIFSARNKICDLVRLGMEFFNVLDY